ncbi:low affinity iron permease family protein [Mycobacterium sp. 2YAF39]|uniref:low affinity iron permease family protein n=1 Tax=Mycobacterium sp. 2YAF39 TaxID=3233033 RepID=UPI003F9BABCE
MAATVPAPVRGYPTFWLCPSIDGSALVINTFTSTITFLLVALLQNTETRAENATQRKLNAIADALADLVEKLGENDEDLRRARDELTFAVGVEHRESTERKGTGPLSRQKEDPGLPTPATPITRRAQSRLQRTSPTNRLVSDVTTTCCPVRIDA